MTEQDRKFLTEWLGEKWYSGKAKGSWRDFTTPTDVQALEQKLVEINIRNEFHKWMDKSEDRWHLRNTASYIQLTSKQRCQLIADFLKSLEC